MDNLRNAPFVMEVRKICALLYSKGWDERNGGNVSYILDNDEVAKYIDINNIQRSVELESPKPEMAGRILIVTATGGYFKNVYDAPEKNLGIIEGTSENPNRLASELEAVEAALYDAERKHAAIVLAYESI